MKKIWRDYNLTIVLTGLFLVSLSLQSWTGWRSFAAEQSAHGQAATILGRDGYIWKWGEATFENWQSEFLQLLTFVVLTAYLVHKGSHESKDTDDRMEAKLDDMAARLARVEDAVSRATLSGRARTS